MKIGDRIKEKREEKSMSQVDLANKINVSKQTLYKYENNIVTNIPSDKIELLAKFLDTTPAYLMGWEDENGYYTDDILCGINAMTNILNYIYDDVDFHEYIMCETFDVILRKDSTEIVLNENEYNLLFDFICSNIPNYIQLIKGKSAKNGLSNTRFTNLEDAKEYLRSQNHLAALKKGDTNLPDSDIVRIANEIYQNNDK